MNLSGCIIKVKVYKVRKLHNLLKNITITPGQNILAEGGQREGGQTEEEKQHYRLKLNQIW